jgi:uncharacterized protein
VSAETLPRTAITSPSERIVTLDILRGLALFGMILVHFHQKMEINVEHGLEGLIGWIVWMGVETKAWATFAFLFGAGFAILMRRLELRGRRVVPVFLRRMLVLAAIGIAVELLLGFRILLEYAIWGVPLLLVRKWPTRALIVLALASAMALTVFGVGRSAASISRLGPERAAVVAKERQTKAAGIWQTLTAAEDSGSYREAVRARMTMAGWWHWRRSTAFVPDSNFVLFILGLLAIRHGIFDDPQRKKKIVLTAMSLGAASWAAAWWLLPKIPERVSIGGASVPLQGGLGIVSDQWLAFTYIGAVTLLLAYRPMWKRRLSAFGTAGRMALTNYVIQAAVVSWLASGYGLSLQIRPYYVVLASAGLFAMLVILSSLWLSRFRYGPLEWMWRSLTYAEWQPTEDWGLKAVRTGD